MATFGIFYGSDTGNTENVANKLVVALGEDNATAFDVAHVADFSIFDNFDVLIFGTPTWYVGELQSDVDEFFTQLRTANISFAGRTVALFGLGDQFGYSDNFVDGLGIIYQFFKEQNAHIIGSWPTEGYTFDSVLALGDSLDHFVGLVIDEDNQQELTDERVATWAQQIQQEIAQ